MGCFPNLAGGIQFLMDSNLNWLRATTPVYLRVRNFTDIQDQTYAELGFSISPSGTAAVGTTDIQILPWPGMIAVSLRNIGLSMGKLRFGARQFFISNTFVCGIQQQFGFAQPSDVWKDPKIVGLVQDNLLFSIDDYTYEAIGDSPVAWFLTCNANELR